MPTLVVGVEVVVAVEFDVVPNGLLEVQPRVVDVYHAIVPPTFHPPLLSHLVKSMNWFQYLLVRSFVSFPTTNSPKRGRVKLTFIRRTSETKPTP